MSLGRDPATPLHRRLCSELRDAVLTGRLAPGARLPASREMARDLGVSRNTVLDAVGQLVAEGYLEGRPRSGTFVRADVPPAVSRPRVLAPDTARLSARGRRLAALWRSPEDAREPFCPGIPALDLFPRARWARLQSAVLRREPAQRLNYPDTAGFRPLREAIAAHVSAARGVRAEADQVLVVSGAQQGMDLVARVLLDHGDAAWIEDPSYAGAGAALAASGTRLVPVPVDAEGLDVRAGRRRGPRARLAYICPSHHYPLGFTMSLPRRLQLLEWARSERAFVIEDDYESEFRYEGHPSPALHGLDSSGVVLYLGTFSKAVFPALRLAYLILPPSLVPAFVRAKAIADGGAPTIAQAVLARFLADGHFARHVRRMRAVYRERREELLHQTGRHLQGLLSVETRAAGLQLVGWLPPEWDDAAAAAAIKRAGLGAPPLSAYCLETRRPPALVLGFAHMRPAEIRAGVRTLAAVLTALARGAPRPARSRPARG